MPKPEVRPSRLAALLLWVIATVGLWISSGLTTLLSPAMEGVNPHVQMLVFNLLYYLPFGALPVFLLAKRRPKLYEAYRPYPISLFNTICTVILALLGVFFVNDITLLWAIPFQKLGFDVFTVSLPAVTTSKELVLSIISVAVLPAVCEEFLFRGAILSAFEDSGTRRAMLLSSLLFTLLHASLLGMPTQMILGMVLAYLVIWTDSIYAGLIYHTVHNAATLLLDYVQNRAPSAAAAQTSDLVEALGGMTGVFSLAFEVLLSGALIVLTLKLFRMRGRLRGITDEPKGKLTLRRSELLVLIIGVVLCAALYCLDISAMLGG